MINQEANQLKKIYSDVLKTLTNNNIQNPNIETQILLCYVANKTKFYNLKLYESFAKIDKRKKLIPTLIKNFKSNKKTIILSSKLELNIVHIDDIIKAIFLSLKSNKINGEAINIGSGNKVKIKKVIEIAKKLLAKEILVMDL